MVKDPKQIVTPFAFSVHPDVLGLPLATPKRRLAALLIDLLIASILTSLGNFVLAIGVTILIFWSVVRTKTESTFKNLLRYAGASVASIFVFLIAISVLESFDTGDSSDVPESIVTVNGNDQIDWADFGSAMATMDYSDPEAIEEGFEELARDFNFDEESTSYESILLTAPQGFIETVSEFRTSFINADTSKVDSLRSVLASTVAAIEIDELGTELDELDDQVDELSEMNETLADQIENPSLYVSVKKAFQMLGLSLGWIGIYFITTIAYFRGQTLGKRILKIRVVRLNNKSIGLFFAFERFGGYAAGIATGLIGFFQMFWDANRQAIHDKIAGTVVIDLRASKIEQTETLRKELIDSENLLSQF